MDENDQPQIMETEAVITMIAGVIHRWNYFPGSWEPFTPQAGDLLRVWKNPESKPPKPK
jgi:hypothetical protein